ncbi:MAG: hypothetical protein JO245_03575 [Pseudolabrys sp.]|nr:hypothetical protein [Pseudolabrys sp.]
MPATLDRIFYAYIVLAGLIAGGVLVQWPQAGDAWLKPYFWMLIAVALFDAAIFAVKKVSPAEAMPLQTRVIGFIGGTLLMAAVVQLSGSPAKLF